MVGHGLNNELESIVNTVINRWQKQQWPLGVALPVLQETLNLFSMGIIRRSLKIGH